MQQAGGCQHGTAMAMEVLFPDAMLIPSNNSRQASVGFMLDQRLRRWPSIEPTLDLSIARIRVWIRNHGDPSPEHATTQQRSILGQLGFHFLLTFFLCPCSRKQSSLYCRIAVHYGVK